MLKNPSKSLQKIEKQYETFFSNFQTLWYTAAASKEKGRENNRVSLGYSPIFDVKWSDGAGIKSLLEVGLFP